MHAFPAASPDFATAPEPGAVLEVAPGLLWARFPLPFALNHVNVYLIEDEGGWAAVDTGIGDVATRANWLALLDGPLRGERLTRLIVTHHHPDHMGLAGWLSERYGLPVHMDSTEYFLAQYFKFGADSVDAALYHDYYRQHGMSENHALTVISQGHAYKRSITGLPPQFCDLTAGETLAFGGRRFEILSGGGHSISQSMLFCREEGLFLAADQVMQRISPNVSVSAIIPGADPLGQYLRSLRQLRDTIPDGSLVLPGHHRPFRTLHDRIDELMAHHEARCELIADVCRATPRTVAELIPVLFTRPLDPHQTSFAFSEAMAHVNLMIRRGQVRWQQSDGVLRVAVA